MQRSEHWVLERRRKKNVKEFYFYSKLAHSSLHFFTLIQCLNTVSWGYQLFIYITGHHHYHLFLPFTSYHKSIIVEANFTWTSTPLTAPFYFIFLWFFFFFFFFFFSFFSSCSFIAFFQPYFTFFMHHYSSSYTYTCSSLSNEWWSRWWREWWEWWKGIVRFYRLCYLLPFFGFTSLNNFSSLIVIDEGCERVYKMRDEDGEMII